MQSKVISALDTSVDKKYETSAQDTLGTLFYNNPRAASFYSDCAAHVRNAGRLRFLGAFRGEIPITSFESETTSNFATYVSTTQAHYVDYAWDEVIFHVRSHIVRGCAWVLLGFVGFLCRLSKVNANDVCFLNNYLISTNLYRDEEDVAENVAVIASELHSDHGMQVVLFRCVDRIGTPTLLSALQRNPNVVLVASRVVNQLDTFDDSIWTRKNSQRDSQIVEKHLGATRSEMKDIQKGTRTVQAVINRCRVESAKSSHILRIVTTDEDVAVFKRIEELYASLYLGKYSTSNPDYSAEFFKKVSALWTIMALERREDGLIEGFISMSETGETVSCPALGYDLNGSTPAYIILQFWAILEAKSRGKRMNMSGGVSAYKQMRGAIPVLEFSGVWIAPEAPWRRRCFWYFMGFITKYIARPILKRKNVY